MQAELQAGERHSNFDADGVIYQTMMSTISEESLEALAAGLRGWIDRAGNRRRFEDSGGPPSD